MRPGSRLAGQNGLSSLLRAGVIRRSQPQEVSWFPRRRVLNPAHARISYIEDVATTSTLGFVH